MQATAISIGFSTGGGDPAAGGGGGSANAANVEVKLQDSEVRTFEAQQFTDLWREAVGDIPGARRLSFSASLVGVGDPIDIEVAADSDEARAKAVAQIKRSLQERNGVFAIRDTGAGTAQEVSISLKPEARAYGLTLAQLAEEVRAGYFGVTARKIQSNREEVDVRVRLPEVERSSIAALLDYRIKTSEGFIPLQTVADLKFEPAARTINRENGRRITSVVADVDEAITTGGQETSYILERVVPKLKNEQPDLVVTVGGEQEEQGRFGPALARNFILALCAIYAVLALAFGSYTRPLLIVAVVPFGFVGALAGHALLGLNLTLLSLFGVIGLAGIIINDALLLVDQIIEEEANGARDEEAIVESVVLRFRPVILTTLTTFFGVSPLILEQSVQAQFLIPTAVALGFGILVGGAFVIFLVPAFASLYAQVRARFTTSEPRPASG
ncbi:MAG: efflux RND transporter permease subunit [Pseudomonadota bacterium]